MNKRGQFFILAAVIIVVIVVSIASIQNYANKKEEPLNFYDLTYNIKQEAGEVIDYGVYNEDEKIEDFVNLAQRSINEKDTSVLFIFGNSNTITIRNNLDVSVAGASGEIEGCGVETESVIYYEGNTKKPVELTLDNFGRNCQYVIDRNDEQPTKVNLIISGQEVNFDIRKDQNFFVVFKKEKEGEQYIAISE